MVTFHPAVPGRWPCVHTPEEPEWSLTRLPGVDELTRCFGAGSGRHSSQCVEQSREFSRMTDHRHVSGIKIDDLDGSEVLDHPILSIQAQTGIEGQTDVRAGNRLSQPREIGRLG